MRIGLPKEIKNHEYRVAVTPAGARQLVQAGHTVRVQSEAGTRIGYPDKAYVAAGAEVVATAQSVYEADLIVKVKEPQLEEIPLLHEDQILFSYLHLAAEPELAQALINRRISALAFETVMDRLGGLPLLTPMSALAGRIAVQAGAQALSMAGGGRGVLLSGVPGVAPGHVVIIGGGTVGMNAAHVAAGMGADVVLLDRNPQKLAYIDQVFQGRVKTILSTMESIAEWAPGADLLIGAVLVPGARAPRLLTRAHLAAMPDGAAFVDVSIDQGGIAETSRPTTHERPTYIEEGVVHYCVTNMPAACARTATQALAPLVLPHVQALASKGLAALADDPCLLAGLNVWRGSITHAAVANALNIAVLEISEVIRGVLKT
ncbi:MAG: alanine dehydrogenase [Thiobacillaceae bacterium]